ncbi:MAG TPA: hypothetical protein VMT54_08055 [Candidatus Cybelea sp.]|nr:hypothetical protein [Candidatus Cybelea sp.]
MTTQTGTAKNDTLTFAPGDTSIDGLAGTDTLLFNITGADLTSTTVTSMEILKATIANTTFTVDQGDLVTTGGSVVGTTGNDTLTVAGASFDLRSTTLSSIEILKSDGKAGTTFFLDQKDLLSGGSVQGAGGKADTISINGTSLDLTSTTLTSIEKLQAGKSAATTFTLDSTDLTGLTAITGSTGTDTLVVKNAAFDVHAISLNSVEALKAGVATATTFTLDEDQLAANTGPVAAITGSTGTDTLAVNGTGFDLSQTTLSSVEKLMATDNGTDGTVFTLDQADLAKGGAVTGSSSTADEIDAAGSSLDLSSTTVSGVEMLASVSGVATTLTITGDQLIGANAFNKIEGDTVGDTLDTLVVKSTTIDLSSTTLDLIDVVKAGSASATTFTFKAGQLASGMGDVSQITGSTGSDTLIVKGVNFDLSSTALTSVEKLQAGSTNAVTFTLDQSDLANGGQVIGSTSAGDDIQAAGPTLDLTSTTISGIEILTSQFTGNTTFTVTEAQFKAIGEFDGNSVNDTLVVKTTNFDVTGKTLDSIANLKVGLASATTFTVNDNQLAGGGGGDVVGIAGSTGSDTLIVKGTDFDLSGTALTSVEKLMADSNGTNNTVFTLNQNDLASKGSIIGNSGATGDKIVAAGTLLDLSSTTVSSIEKLTAGTNSNTTFIVTSAELTSLDISGGKGTDTVLITSNTIDFTGTTLTSIEGVGAGLTTASTITLLDTQLKANGGVIANIQGNNGVDTLKVIGPDFDLSKTTTTGIEKLQSGATAGDSATFTLNQLDLAANGSIIGSSNGSDTIIAADNALDLTSTTLTGVEFLEANKINTTFTLDATDLKALTGGVSGNGGTNTLIMNTSAFDVSSATLSDVEKLQAGVATTTFTVAATELVSGGGDINAVVGNAKSTDTLIVKGTNFDLSGTTLTNVDVLKAGSSLATTFTIDDDTALISGGSVVGSSGNDTLLTHDTVLDLTSTTLSSVEILQSDNGVGTNFIVDQKDLASGGSVIGDADDAIVAAGTSLDLTSTILSSIEIIQAGNAATGGTILTVDANDLESGGSVIGNAGNDTLIVKNTGIDLTSTSLTSVEKLQAGLSAATTFTVDQADLASGGSVIGSSGTDTLLTHDNALDLSSTALTSIEVLKSDNTNGVTFTLDQNDIASGGSIIGAAGSDTIAASGNLDLTSTTLSSIENVTVAASSGATVTLTAAQLAGINVSGGTATTDTLVIKGTAFDLTSTTLTAIERLQASNNGSSGTTFTLDAADVAALGTNGQINGSTSSNDTLIILGTAFDLTSTALSSVEILKAGSSLDTTFTLDGADIAGGGSIIGSSGNDTIVVNSTAIDISSTTLSSIEALTAGTTNDTTFTINQSQLNAGLSVTGNSGHDTLTIAGTSFDLTSASVTSVEILKAGSSLDTTFTVDQADLASGGSVVGLAGHDTLIVKGTSADLSSTSLTSVEILKTGSALATTFKVDQADLASGGSIIGSSGNDTVAAAGNALDLTSTTLSSIEIIKAGLSVATTFTVDQADLASGGSVIGSSGNDTLIGQDDVLDLTSTTLSSIEIIKVVGVADPYTIKLDQADLASGGTVIGGTNNDTIIINGTQLDLSSTTLNSIEILKAGTTSATTFIVNQSDLASGGTVVGSSSTGDTVETADTQLDLTSTTLSGIEKIGAGTDNDTTITVSQSIIDSLGAGGTIFGGAGADTLQTGGTLLDLSNVLVTGVEAFATTNTVGTTFVLTQSDLIFGGSITGGSGTDTVEAAGTALNLSNTTLTSIEALSTASTVGTTFTLAALQQKSLEIDGGSGVDTLVIKSASFDLTSTTDTSLDILKAGVTTATTFTVDAADLATGGSVLGTGKNDTLTILGTAFDLSHTSLSSVEILKTASSLATTFTVDQADLASGGTIIGSSGNDTVLTHGTQLDLSSTSLTSIEILKSDSTAGAVFTVDAADLASGGSVIGGSGTDTLLTHTTGIDLTSTSLTSIEILQSHNTVGTTFTVDTNDLASGGSVIGGSGDDTLSINSNTIDLRSTTLTSIEHITSATPTNGTTFTVGGGLGSASIEFDNGGNDSAIFKSGYKATDVSSESTILAHTVSINTFDDANDTIDVSAISKGAGSYQDIQAVIDFLDPATLKDALDLAAHTAVGANSKVVSFEFGGDTYVVVDNSSAQTLTTDDAVIKVVGTGHTFTTGGGGDLVA